MNYASEAEVETRSRARAIVVLALLTVYLVWGSTYLAIKVALESYPPFGMASVRFAFAGAVLYAWLRLRGAPPPSAAQWRNCAVTGTLLLGAGNGLVCFAETSVSSSLAAVAVASMPLFAAVFAGLYGKWPRRWDWVGLAIGFGGVILLNLGGEMQASRAGAIALVGAPLAWAFGSVWSKHQDMPGAWMSTAAQMLTGAIALGAVTLAIGEQFPAAPSARATGALVYLAIFGSIAAFTAYVYLLNTVRPALATSYAYVNPPVAVLLGVWLGGESFGTIEAVAMAVILAGVAIILLQRR
ncbi:MAG TPA: drug/metabolite exporter YedA [Candidatus Saccharimonadia bacterium]|nr:drug/metabolite exporter YedA [Candidatus Saccharimonadia bacterium]